MAERVRLDQAGVEFPDLGDLWSQSRQRQRARREAVDAVRAQAAGQSPEEIRELYMAELRARGLRVPAPEVLDANISALAGDYRPVARLVGQAVADAVKFLRGTHER